MNGGINPFIDNRAPKPPFLSELRARDLAFLRPLVQAKSNSGSDRGGEVRRGSIFGSEAFAEADVSETSQFDERTPNCVN